MKPDTVTAMRQLIVQIRAALPRELRGEQLCSDACEGCSVKLLTFLEDELAGWELRLDNGERPNFGDLNKLARTGRKIYRVLEKNGLCN